MFVIPPLKDRKPIKVWQADTAVVEASAVEQLLNLAKLPFLFKHLAAMPDVHAGKGSTVGTVIATVGAVIPAAVGVDIGCGMMAWDTGLPAEPLRKHAAELRRRIEASVPTGFNSHKEPLQDAKVHMGARSMPHWVPSGEYGQIRDKAMAQFGTLGGGNHFIEVCEDDRGAAWVMLHTGSRAIGKLTADHHMGKASELCQTWLSSLPDPDLAFLPRGTVEYDVYMQDLAWCQKYAWANREAIMRLVAMEIRTVAYMAGIDRQGLRTEFQGSEKDQDDSLVHCHHNYSAMENHFGANVLVTRKGAISARAGQLGIIPGSMGARSYIVRGLGNPESFNSASHGAGRRMGRNEARRQFSMADLAEQTAGVECRKDEKVIDEIPGAYKDIDQVMDQQKDLVEKVRELKQFLCVKG